MVSMLGRGFAAGIVADMDVWCTRGGYGPRRSGGQ